MNPHKQQRAIAEACGYTFEPEGDRHYNGQDFAVPEAWYDSDGAMCNPPDYLNDLNAMHEAEKTLSIRELWDMRLELIKMMSVDYPYFHSTAAQRAEAFLRTINKWEEE